LGGITKSRDSSRFPENEGKPMNFDNLKNESNKLVQFANESTQRVGEIYNENKPYINNAGSGLWNVFRYIGWNLRIHVFILFNRSICSIRLHGSRQRFPPVSKMNFYFDNDSMKYIIMALITLGSLIPAMIFGLLSIKLISPKTKLRNTGWVIGALFLALISLGTYFGISMARQEMFVKVMKKIRKKLPSTQNLTAFM
jgi:hypothetical protein